MIDTEYDLGFIRPPKNGKGIKVTLNKFRGIWYLHIREYIEDVDEGIWYPTGKGIAIESEYVGILSYSVDQAEKLLRDIFYNEIDTLIDKQLELFNEGLNGSNENMGG